MGLCSHYPLVQEGSEHLLALASSRSWNWFPVDSEGQICKRSQNAMSSGFTSGEHEPQASPFTWFGARDEHPSAHRPQLQFQTQDRQLIRVQFLPYCARDTDVQELSSQPLTFGNLSQTRR